MLDRNFDRLCSLGIVLFFVVLIASQLFPMFGGILGLICVVTVYVGVPIYFLFFFDK